MTKCNYTDTKTISITVGPREEENIEILKKHVGRQNRSYAICEAINRYAEQIKAMKM